MFWGQAVELRLALKAAGEGGMARYPMRPHSLGVGATRAGITFLFKICPSPLVGTYASFSVPRMTGSDWDSNL